MRFKQSTVFILILILSYTCFGQDIELFQQFNGRYDYTVIGNTLNLVENEGDSACDILTSSSATLNLNPNQTIEAAYIYWAGSGLGDFDIELNGIPITAERTFIELLGFGFSYFAAFADVTNIIQAEGNTDYTVSEFDISDVIQPYCIEDINFGGWAITIIYQDDSLPLNQVNVYDGFQRVPNSITITLDNLNVLDNEGAKIGFVAWEGDSGLAVNEQLTVNGNLIGNPPLNPFNNAFNGTNSFTGASDLYNMDIDVYDIENNISIGDTTATIQLTSGSDIVVINNIITVLNSQLPDATIALDNAIVDCTSRAIHLDYTVFNSNSTDPLPSNTPIAFYADNVLVGQSATVNTIDIGDSEAGSMTLLIPETINNNFTLTLVVDDDGSGLGTVNEINEENNTYLTTITLLTVPPSIALPPTLLCDEGNNSATFDLYAILEDNDITTSPSEITFYNNLSDLEALTNNIFNPYNYTNSNSPETVYVRLENQPCYVIYTLELSVENCPPHIPQGFSPNNDNTNDWFNIQGLYDIFEDHELKIFNRYGTLIFEGDNDLPWSGRTNRGINNHGKLVPVGTYFYILNLNDPNYKPFVGWVYVNY
ncbi:gliding motility-associated C-terminal domain-containing protein [Psychroserpens sp. XS_ASV72]|uniref:gliding motility-associated C-terminal domain-containing protein n=1 Tax=Psychroserpens sp. XS_ASV72 TaxID=3241293 RepID=UPI00351234B0